MSKHVEVKALEKAIIENAQDLRTLSTKTVGQAISSLPTIEVSEDCISRADLLKTIDDNVSQQYSYTYETYGLDLWALFVRIVKNAPSVVPSRMKG